MDDEIRIPKWWDLDPKERWELALVETPEKARQAGPPAWLVMERRKGQEDVHITAQRIRDELWQ